MPDSQTTEMDVKCGACGVHMHTAGELTFHQCDPRKTDTTDTSLGSLEDTVKKLSDRINGNDETYKALLEFAYKLLMIAGVKII